MIWASVKRHPLGIIGLGFLALMFILAVGANWLAPYDPTKLSGKPFEPPGSAHLL